MCQLKNVHDTSDDKCTFSVSPNNDTGIVGISIEHTNGTQPYVCNVQYEVGGSTRRGGRTRRCCLSCSCRGIMASTRATSLQVVASAPGIDLAAIDPVMAQMVADGVMQVEMPAISLANVLGVDQQPVLTTNMTSVSTDCPDLVTKCSAGEP